MKYENIEKAMKVQSKLNGKWYEVKGVSEDGADLTEILSDDQISDGVKPDELILTPKNAICFRLDPDSIPHHVPEGYDVVDGILMHGGAPVTEQGEIVLDDHIYGYMLDSILLSKKIPDKNEHQFISYNVAKDKFEQITDSFPFTECKEDDLGSGTKSFIITKKSTVSIKDEDGNCVLNEDGTPQTKEVITDCGILVFCPDDSTAMRFIEAPELDYSDIKIIKGTSIFPDELLFVANRNMIPYSDDEIKGYVEDESSKDDICLAPLGTYGVWENVIHLPGDVKSVTRDLNHSLVIKGNDYFYFENRGHNPRMVQNKKIAVLAGFDHLVFTDIRNSKETYVFANDQMEVKTLVRTKTYDRGDIVTVE